MNAGDSIAVRLAERAEQLPALGLVFQHLEDQQLAALLQGLVSVADAQASFPGLFVAEREGRLVGAVWAQPHPGATAALWPPGVQVGEPASTAGALLAAADAFLERSGVRMVQSLLESDMHPSAGPLCEAGHVFFAKLLYLVSATPQLPEAAPRGRLQFETYSEANHGRLLAIIEQTYDGTRDCPRLNGVRRIDDVLVGYRATGAFDAARWQIARLDGEDIGCVLLADHPGADQVELMYMGLTPAARGKRLGTELVRQAQWLTRLANRPRLILAVDAANSFAIETYRAAGFTLWNERSVFLKIF